MRQFSDKEGKDLAEYLRLGRRPCLLLGAGCGIPHGLPVERDLLDVLATNGTKYDSLEAYINSVGLLTAQTFLHERLIQTGSTEIYDALVQLIAANVFGTIFTLNYDFILEYSLAKALRPDQYRTFIRGDIDDKVLADRLVQKDPMVKLIKLHSDTLSMPVTHKPEVMRFNTVLENTLEQLFRKNGLVIAGYSMKEPRLMRVAGNTEDVWIVDPRPNPEMLSALGIDKCRVVSGEDGRFENFVHGLCRQLLGGKYRDLWNTHGRPSDSRKIAVLARELREERTRTTWSEDNVRVTIKDLVERLSSSLRKLSSERVCLVFVHDPSAPGGSELLRRIRNEPTLSDQISAYDIRCVRIGGRENETHSVRAVTGWMEESKAPSNDTYDTIVVVDVVSFSGQTLEVARRFAENEIGDDSTVYFASLLITSAETTEQLHSNGWRGVIAAIADYESHEITLPWGWTRATKFVPIGPREELHARRSFGYTPKPWGHQIDFVSNQLCSIRQLYIAGGSRTSTHIHLLRGETFIAQSAGVRIVIGDQAVDLPQNDALRVPPGVPHYVAAIGTDCTLLEIADGPYDQRRDIVRLSDPFEPRTIEGSDNGLI